MHTAADLIIINRQKRQALCYELHYVTYFRIQYNVTGYTGGTSVHVNMANITTTTGGTFCGTTLGPQNRNKHLSVACAVETQARYVRLNNPRANPIRSYCELIAEVGIDEGMESYPDISMNGSILCF